MKKVITISATALAILSMFFISFSFINTESAHAESSSTQASLEIDSIINISAPPTVTLNCTPGATDAQAELCTSTANVIVTTNNITGYTLQMNATSGSPTALTNSAASPAATIPTLSQAYSSSNFPVNSWGYTGGTDKSSETGGYNCSTNYCPILAYDSGGSYPPNHIIKVTDGPATTSNTNITFGAKVDTSKPSGTYATSVTFTAVTNAIPTPAMQDFTTSACANATADQTFTLRDSRDDKEYTIAKLQDGNCWMTQNLDLGGPIAMNLTPADTNIASDFTLPASAAEGSGSQSEDNPIFYDIGNLYWTGEICEMDPELPENPICPSGNPPTSSTGSQSYHLGNYYNWPAATAGSGANVVAGSDAQYSICPKNWHLPTNTEQQTLINTYPELSNPSTDAFAEPPFSLTLSGSYYSYIYRAGNIGHWWSSTTANNSNAAYGLEVIGPYRGISHNLYYKSANFSVRCLVPGS